MHFDDTWTTRPDFDGDRAVPATFRNVAPWDSAFTQNGHQHDAGDDQAGRGTLSSEDWVVGSLMGVYND